MLLLRLKIALEAQIYNRSQCSVSSVNREIVLIVPERYRSVACEMSIDCSL